MSVDDAQTVQTPERFSLPSLVWFYCSDRIYRILPQSLYFSKSIGFVFRGAVCDWEIDFAIPGVGSTPESTRHTIKSRPETLDYVARDGWNHWSDWLRVRDLICGPFLRINVTNDFVWPSLPEFGDCPIHIRDVLVGPLDFDPD